jgi:putative membrane protein
MSVNDLPTINAVLNSLSAGFLVAGFVYIKKKNIGAHKRAMLTAFTLSAIFLVSYIIYHYTAGATAFTGEGWIRPVYFSILASHTILATLVLPPILVLLYFALRGNYTKHARIARWTYPVWLYVSATGVIIYLILYHWYPSG